MRIIQKCRGAASVCVAFAATQLLGQAAPVCVHPITAAALVSALEKEQSSISERDISVPEGIVTRGSAPDFTVLSIEHVSSANNQYWVKIGCRDAGDCLPFYASVFSEKPLTSGMRNSGVAHPVPASPPLMHVGERATLVIHRDRSSIELAVVVLESGSVGQNIRVASPDYKQFFHGRVVSPAELDGSM